MVEAAQAGMLEGRRVLVVEDQYLIADSMRRAVAALGGEVVGCASDCEQAQALLERSAVDLALLDVNLAGDQVFPVAEALADRGVPFVFATGYDVWMLPQAFRDRPRLEKPVTVRSLRDALRSAGLGA